MKKRGKNLSDTDIEDIVRIIDGWEEPLSWNALIQAIADRHHLIYTRQTLHKHERIRHAFNLHRSTLAATTSDSPPKKRGSIELQKAYERIAHLEAKIGRLDAETELFLEQYARWSFNAYQHGISIDELNAPLPSISRGQTSITLPDTTNAPFKLTKSAIVKSRMEPTESPAASKQHPDHIICFDVRSTK